MKHLKFIIILFVVFNSCSENLITPENGSLVVKINMKQLEFKYLSNFELTEKRVFWNKGRRYNYYNNNYKIRVSIQVGLYESSKDAESIALDYLKFVSIAMMEGQIDNKPIGDKLWYWPNSNSTPSGVTNIVFIRYNALFILSSNNSGKLTELAQVIDKDIVAKAYYIKTANAIMLPQIDSISVTKAVLHEGETSDISVYGYDSDNETLEYVCQCLNVFNSPNIFRFFASKDNVPEPFIGLHTLNFIVINESNVVSKIVETKLSITE